MSTLPRSKESLERRIPVSVLVGTAFIVQLFALPGCAPRTPHETTGYFGRVQLQRACVSGRVTDAVTGRGIHEAKVQLDPPVPGAEVKTTRDGFFYLEVPGGSYRLTFVKQGYREFAHSVQLKNGETAGRDASLEPQAAVVVDAGKGVTGAAPGSTVTVKAQVTVRDGAQPGTLRWQWRQGREEGGVTALLSQEHAPELRVKLPGVEDYKRALLYRLGKQGRLHDRWMVLPLTASDLREAGRVTVSVSAATATGNYTDAVDIVADLGSIAAVNPGVHTVPVGKAVLLQGKSQPSYAWSLKTPGGSAAALNAPTSANPSFTPDVPGSYLVLEGNRERLKIRAGQWNGAVVAEETDIRGRWIGVGGCMCHTTDPMGARFKLWRQSGHAEIFNQCVNTVFSYQESCFACHSVGFGGKGAEGGLTSPAAYPEFKKDQTLWNHGREPAVIRPKPGNAAAILKEYPGVAKFANVQCENCHGPNNSPSHGKKGEKGVMPQRTSLTAELCGMCHDDLTEDPSFQQWLDAKKHANYGLALSSATVETQGELAGDCGRCHAAQGFLGWLARGERTALLAPSGSATALNELAALGLTREQVHPVTCAVCHEPHNPGSTFRWATEKVPTRGADYKNMHPREFRNDQGGRGAVCITCHSTFWGAYNDAALPMVGSDVAPHVGQGDVLFGENAFFVKTGAYKSHARVEDTCVWCHVKSVPKSAKDGYPRRKARHTFRADVKACASCHDFSGEDLMAVVEKDTATLKEAIEQALVREIGRKGRVTLVKAGAGGADVQLSSGELGKLRLSEAGRSMAVEVDTAGRAYKVPLGQLYPGGEDLRQGAFGQLMVKAAWNYFLIERDGSRGSHNPQFVREVLAVTLRKVRGG